MAQEQAKDMVQNVGEEVLDGLVEFGKDALKLAFKANPVGRAITYAYDVAVIAYYVLINWDTIWFHYGEFD